MLSSPDWIETVVNTAMLQQANFLIENTRAIASPFLRKIEPTLHSVRYIYVFPLCVRSTQFKSYYSDEPNIPAENVVERQLVWPPHSVTLSFIDAYTTNNPANFSGAFELSYHFLEGVLRFPTRARLLATSKASGSKFDPSNLNEYTLPSIVLCNSINCDVGNILSGRFIYRNELEEFVTDRFMSNFYRSSFHTPPRSKASEIYRYWCEKSAEYSAATNEKDRWAIVADIARLLTGGH